MKLNTYICDYLPKEREKGNKNTGFIWIICFFVLVTLLFNKRGEISELYPHSSADTNNTAT